MNISIIYEDKNIIAVNKPSGLVVHATGKGETETLVDWVTLRYPEMEKVGEPLTLSSGGIIHRAGIVHRLDKDTSGILIIAKNQNTFLFLKKQFQRREVQKTYKAIVHGVIKVKRGEINFPIGRSAKRFDLRSADARAKGPKREAITEYAVLESTDSFSYLSIIPKTGRTHQIRVHLKSIGHPVLCDVLYAPKRECPKEMGRLALHAFSLKFETVQGASLRLEAPIPKNFLKIMQRTT